MVFDIRIENNHLFSVGDDRSLRVWTLSQLLNKSSTQIAEVYGHLARPLKIEFAPESSLVFTAGDDQTVCMWKWRHLLGRQEELFLHYKICLYGCGSIRSLLRLGDILVILFIYSLHNNYLFSVSGICVGFYVIRTFSRKCGNCK